MEKCPHSVDRTDASRHIADIETGDRQMTKTITLTLNRRNQMELTWHYTDERQARFFANIAASKGYHVKWTESWEDSK
jgi:hypothetical protein